MAVVPVDPKRMRTDTYESGSGSPAKGEPTEFQRRAAMRFARLYHANMGFSPDERYRENLNGPYSSKGMVHELKKTHDALALSGDAAHDPTFRYPNTTEERAAKVNPPSDKPKTPEQIKSEADAIHAAWAKANAEPTE